MTSSETRAAPLPRGPRNAFDPRRDMLIAAAALIPSFGAAVWFHGARVPLAVATALACGAAVEAGFSKVRRHKVELSWSLLVTGLVFALILPPGMPLWMVGLGAAFGVFFGKQVFGGTGHNIFNPALVGKCFLWLSWPSAAGEALKATEPLAEGGAAGSAWTALLGPAAGGSGEACAAAILIGALALLLMKVASWRILVSTLVSAGALSGVLWLTGGQRFASPVLTLLSGGLLFGACFIAMDPVTSPGTGAGKWAYGVLIGVLVVLIRNLSAYATYTEAMMFAVLLGNLFAPAIGDVVLAITSGAARREPGADG